MSRPRALLLGGALLVLLLALTPLIPRGERDDGLRPSGSPETSGWVLSGAPGGGRLTQAMASEIDRVVAEGRGAGHLSAKQSAASLVADLVRCAVFDGQNYCLGLGWTDQTEEQVRARMTVAARPRQAGDESTGDLDVLGQLNRQAARSPSARARAERRELTAAARSVAKVWVLRHEIQGVPLPDGFLADHPEARARGGNGGPSDDTTAPPCDCPTNDPAPSPSTSVTPTAAPDKTIADYPEKGLVLDPSQVAEQSRTYWCGPTSMQMIAWGWKGEDRGQDYWAGKLRTTTSGTAITDMVRVTNANTGWDLPSHAGTYVVLDVGGFTFEQWLLLNLRHIVDYQAPLIYHPILLKEFYPYLDDDASGHYQVGRGYLKRDGKPTEVSYFEPWNQQLFDPSEPFIKRVQWRDAYRSYRANLAHPFHNIGA